MDHCSSNFKFCDDAVTLENRRQFSTRLHVRLFLNIDCVISCQSSKGEPNGFTKPLSWLRMDTSNLKCLWQIPFYFLDRIYLRSWFGNPSIKLDIAVFSPSFSRLKTEKSETACGRGLRQIRSSTSKQEPTLKYISKQAIEQKQQQKSNKGNVLGIRQSSVIQILFQDANVCFSF